MNYFFFSQRQEDIVQQFPICDDEIYEKMFVKINGQWKRFSEIDSEKSPCGTFDDYKYVGCLTDKEYNSGKYTKYE
jgi:hypothetical protein